MKKIVFTVACAYALFASGHTYAQGMGINSTGTAANASAILDVSSTTQGLLIPRMTASQRSAISGGTPATGLLVYQTDGIAGFYYYSGAAWVSLGTGTMPQPHEAVFSSPGTTAFTTSANITASTVFKVTVTGGGGGGGGYNSLYPPPGDNGGGGAGGSTSIYWATGLSPSTSYTVVIGAGGAGGGPVGSGTAGASSSIDVGATIITAAGGGAGSVAIFPAGGIHGGSSFATISLVGGDGGEPTSDLGGIGGSSFWSSGGSVPVTLLNKYGCGGAGSYYSAGASGAGGIVVVEWSE